MLAFDLDVDTDIQLVFITDVVRIDAGVAVNESEGGNGMHGVDIKGDEGHTEGKPDAKDHSDDGGNRYGEYTFLFAG